MLYGSTLNNQMLNWWHHIASEVKDAEVSALFRKIFKMLWK